MKKEKERISLTAFLIDFTIISFILLSYLGYLFMNMSFQDMIVLVAIGIMYLLIRINIQLMILSIARKYGEQNE